MKSRFLVGALGVLVGLVLTAACNGSSQTATNTQAASAQVAPKFVGVCLVEMQVGFDDSPRLFGLRDDGKVYVMEVNAMDLIDGSLKGRVAGSMYP